MATPGTRTFPSASLSFIRGIAPARVGLLSELQAGICLPSADMIQ